MDLGIVELDEQTRELLRPLLDHLRLDPDAIIGFNLIGAERNMGVLAGWEPNEKQRRFLSSNGFLNRGATAHGIAQIGPLAFDPDVFDEVIKEYSEGLAQAKAERPGTGYAIEEFDAETGELLHIYCDGNPSEWGNPYPLVAAAKAAMLLFNPDLQFSGDVASNPMLTRLGFTKFKGAFRLEDRIWAVSGFDQEVDEKFAVSMATRSLVRRREEVQRMVETYNGRFKDAPFVKAEHLTMVGLAIKWVDNDRKVAAEWETRLGSSS